MFEMLKKNRYMKVKKGNFKCVNTFYLFGYENLRFQEIEEIISKYVESHKPLSSEGNKEIKEFDRTSNPKQVQPPVLKEVCYIPDTSNDRTLGTLPSRGKPVPIKPISLYEYALKINTLTLSNSFEERDSRQPVGEPTSSHSNFVLKPVPASSQRNVEDYNDPLVIWFVLYMIHLILIDHKDEKEWYNTPKGAPISSEVLERIFGNRRKIALAKEIVDYANIMERFAAIHTQDVHRSDCFRLSIGLRATTDLGSVIRYPVDDPNISRLLIDAYNRQLKRKPLDAVSKKSLKILQALRIRGDEARKYVDEKYDREYRKEISKKKPNSARLTRLQATRDNRYAYIESIEHIEEDAFVTRDDFGGRLYSTFTMSPKELRPFLYFEGCDEDLYLIDLSNAMAVFMVPTLLEHYLDNEWKQHNLEFGSIVTFLQWLRQWGTYEDVIKYITLVMNGEFYGEMYRLMHLGEENLPAMDSEAKRNLKTKLCRHVFYGKNWWEKRIPYKANVEKAFEKNFPNVHKVVTDIKHDDYKELAKVLFKKEVSIFVDGILKDLVWKEKKPFILSIHDGLLVRESDVQDVVDRLAVAFKKWDLQVSISVENIHTGETRREILNKLPDWERMPQIRYKWKGEDRYMWAKKVG